MSKPFEVPYKEQNVRINKAEEDRISRKKRDKKINVVTHDNFIKLDVIKAAYIGEGLNAIQISEKFSIPVDTVQAIIQEGKLISLRRIMVRDGLHRLQNKQVRHAQDLLELENSFKHMKIQQLKVVMEDHMAYLAEYGDFYRRNKDGEILLDQNGIPSQIKLPNAAKDIKEIKDSLVMGEGLKKILEQIQLVLEGDEVSSEDLDLEELFIESDNSGSSLT